MTVKPTRSEAMLGKCHNCSHFYEDGKEDCEVTACELYWYMPYRKLEPDLSWMAYNPRSKGLVPKEETKREFTPEQKEAMAKRLEEARARRANGDADIQDPSEESDSGGE